ncbi:hypothetical protein MNV49_007528 [Pseudohyphozyma bogoriensis]|nr:hypothetical protein MNV49_007528 [Pseudohyphozyma bogoriensis]
MSSDLKSNTSYHPIDTIPNETLSHIFSYLRRPAVLALTRVSKRLREVATPELYSTIELWKWRYTQANALINELNNRPHLLEFIHVIAVTFLSPDELAQELVDEYNVNAEERVAEDKELCEGWKFFLGSAEDRWRANYDMYLDVVDNEDDADTFRQFARPRRRQAWLEFARHVNLPRA